jgi:hypothetical protein
MTLQRLGLSFAHERVRAGSRRRFCANEGRRARTYHKLSHLFVERRSLAIDEEMYSVFASLACEIVDSLPTFCTPKPRSIAKLTEVAS